MAERTPAPALLEQVRSYHAELTTFRRDIHAHPELGLETHRTADLVAELLKSWGIEVHRMVDGAGLVGVLRTGNGPHSIGLRADMDALPIHERTEAAYRSNTSGAMHACGHDGHTTMLLGAARYLAETRQFNGTVNFIFQPGEEGRAVRSPCCRKACSRGFPRTSSTGFTTVQACRLVTSRSRRARQWPAGHSSTSQCEAVALMALGPMRQSILWWRAATSAQRSRP